MRYLLIGLLLLALLLSFCLWITADASSRFQEILLPLEQAETLAMQGSRDEAESLCRQAAALWQRHYPALAAVMNHKDLDEVTRSFSALQQAAPEEFLSSCSSLLALLRSFREADRLNFHNLL